MKPLRTILVAASSGLMLCLSGFHGSAIANVLVNVQPSSISNNLGRSFELSVNITSVVDLFAFQFDVTFVPTVLSATGVSEGPFLSTGGTTFFVPGNIDNATGEITFTADSLLGALPGVTGNGALATVTFSSIGAGMSPVGLQNLVLLDSGLNDIAADVMGGTVTVTPASPVPEPAMWPIVLLGFTVICLWRGFRSAQSTPAVSGIGR